MRHFVQWEKTMWTIAVCCCFLLQAVDVGTRSHLVSGSSHGLCSCFCVHALTFEKEGENRMGGGG